MILTKKIQKALNLAALKHNGQIRKSSKLPYIVHPFSVAIILSKFTNDEDVITAGLLHDLLEDAENYSYQDLKNDFGGKVADIVLGISEKKDLNQEKSAKETWQERKINYLNNLKNQNQESFLVCGADKIHNLRSMTRIYRERKEKMWEDFNAPLERQIWYYEAVLKTLKEKLNNPIIEELESEFEKFKRAVN